MDARLRLRTGPAHPDGPARRTAQDVSPAGGPGPAVGGGGPLFEEARKVTIPLQVLLQWDDEGNDRQLALDLFDAFDSPEKTLHANLGGHTGVPDFEGDAGNRFFRRHLT